MSRQIIRRIKTAHCKKGPEFCDECRRGAAELPCLLLLDPSDAGLAQRQLIEVVMGGEKGWHEYDILRSFESDSEARVYAARNHITDVGL